MKPAKVVKQATKPEKSAKPGKATKPEISAKPGKGAKAKSKR